MGELTTTQSQMNWNYSWGLGEQTGVESQVYINNCVTEQVL